ncbi:hypothetical protein [Arhodomonas sp. AD133]|uniref:hypothetical protein n=1 Tax=Arhodomonas sp. AD133 TaxID=3415009 RepID=UPI003EC12AB9
MQTASLQAQRERQREVVDYLARSAGAGDDHDGVEVLETHLSWLFLTASTVLKLKKPLQYAYLDYSSVAARRRQCAAEVRLNRRLAPAVYLGVSAVTETVANGLALDGNGAAVEHLVRMRRLPAAASLERLLECGGPSLQCVDALATTLTRFYEKLPGACRSPDHYLARLYQDIQADLEALTAPRYGLDRSLVRRVGNALTRMVDAQASTLMERARAGRVVEGHGDLRPEHVYFSPQPVVIDCLEFSRDLRTLDAVDELGLLAMECERRQAGWVGRRLVRRYAELAADEPTARLCALFMARRALLWAKLGVWHLDRDPARDRDKWMHRAVEYLTLAQRYVL